jgi:hypothetical protein|tara:strand:+ start:763 stop:906 length:144 start_codon:yes stop_codon:yes gene_type:complete
MIKEILELLAITDSKAEIVQLAKGKNKFPDSFKELVKRQKQNIEWKK